MRSAFIFSIFAAAAVASASALRHPDVQNSQQCQDDAGPPWQDDEGRAYFEGYAAKPILIQDSDGSGNSNTSATSCPAPLAGACASKGALAAFHDGPVDCGGKGWFCIITEQPGHYGGNHYAKAGPGRFPDANFAFCDQKDFHHDRDGHCHGSDVADTYGWWVRDHWHRNYAGKLRCCCGWGEAMEGYVNRCDYRKHVTPKVLKTCRDANEEHKVDWGNGCGGEDGSPLKALTKPDPSQCWEMEGFGPAKVKRAKEGSNTDNNSHGSKPSDDDEKDDACSRFMKKRKCKRKGDALGCAWDKATQTCSSATSSGGAETEVGNDVDCSAFEKKRMCKRRGKGLCSWARGDGCVRKSRK